MNDNPLKLKSLSVGEHFRKLGESTIRQVLVQEKYQTVCCTLNSVGRYPLNPEFLVVRHNVKGY